MSYFNDNSVRLRTFDGLRREHIVGIRLDSLKSRQGIGRNLGDDMRQVLQNNATSQIWTLLPQGDALVASRPSDVDKDDGRIISVSSHLPLKI